MSQNQVKYDNSPSQKNKMRMRYLLESRRYLLESRPLFEKKGTVSAELNTQLCALRDQLFQNPALTPDTKASIENLKDLLLHYKHVGIRRNAEILSYQRYPRNSSQKLFFSKTYGTKKLMKKNKERV